MRRAGPTHAMLAELREQPTSLERMLSAQSGDIRKAVGALRRQKPGLVVFVARGTSHNAAIYGQYLIESLMRIPTGTAMPSLTTIYGATPNWKGAAVVGISQSGRSVDVTEVMAEARRQGALTLALTNDTQSPLARTCAHVLNLDAGPEISVAATKTFTASLAMLAALVAGWGRSRELAQHLVRLPGAVAEVLGKEATAARLARRYSRRERWVVTTRGYMLGVADEAALKLKETSYVSAESISAAELLHGPIAAVDRKSTVLLLVPPGRSLPGLSALWSALRSRSVSTVTFDLGGGDGDVTAGAGLPEQLAPIAAAPAIQMFAYHLSVARGLNPDRPRGLTKVTLTR